MPILTIGNVGSEVELRLKFNNAISDDEAVALMVKSIEAKVKTLINRNFEIQTFTQQPHDVEINQSVIFLTETPVVTFTTLEFVTSRDDGTGLPDGTQVLNRDTYFVDNDAGIIESLIGPFPRGRAAVLATYSAGYTAADISDNLKLEVLVMKELLLRMLDREFKIWDQGERHLALVTLGDQSFTLQQSMTEEDKQDINMLQLPVAFR